MIKPSIQLARLAATDPRIDEYEHDPVDGHFLHLSPGFCESDYGAHSIRGSTVNAVLEKLYLIQPE